MTATITAARLELRLAIRLANRLAVRLPLLLCICVAIANCRSAHQAVPATEATEWVVQQRYAASALPFELLGKVGTPRGAANIRWQQRGGRFDLRLWGPFGSGVAIIHGDAQWVRFERDDQVREGDPALILAAELGWSVPVGALGYWLRGLPAPEGPVTALELLDGRLARMQQAGWSIAIDRYQQQLDGGWLPARLTARRADVRFTLVVQSWVVGAAVDRALPDAMR